MRFTVYEYFSGTDEVTIEIPDEEIKQLAEECRNNGDDRDIFEDTLRQYVYDNRWDYEVSREESHDRDYTDNDFADDFNEGIYDWCNTYEDEYLPDVRDLGEFGNDDTEK